MTPARLRILRFDGVKVGDEVHVDNRKFLAFCYFHRHHVMDDPQFDGLELGGVPINPQHPVPTMSPLMGVAYIGQYEGKLLWVHHTHDSSRWPSQVVGDEAAVAQAQGEAARAEKSWLQWTENAEHGVPVREGAGVGACVGGRAQRRPACRRPHRQRPRSRRVPRE